MTELRDGFLYHPDGRSPTDQLKRLVAGAHNLVLDNMFGTTRQEAQLAAIKAKKDHEKALERLILLKATISRLEQAIEEAKEHEVAVTDAIAQFDETGEIDDILVPACNALLASERQLFDNADAPNKAMEIDAATKQVNQKLGENWDVSDTHADEEFVYITVKCRRETPPPSPRPTQDSVVQKVKQAFEAHRLAFVERVKPARLTSVVVGVPRAP
ncbi:MAG: hypothetical protein ABJJ53_16395 [Sulfitobacter sp.]